MKYKYLSILGDSISTYRGVSNDGSASLATLANPYFYKEPFPLDGTYFRLLATSLGVALCVNNSYSGGNLTGRDNADAGVNRAAHLAADDGREPDLIIVFMGLNDLGRRVDVKTFGADYRLTLDTIAKSYPNADVCCVNLPDRDPFLREGAIAFNAEIAEAVAIHGERFFVADLFSSRLDGDFYYMNTLDGLHPDEDGMRIIAEVIEAAIRAHATR